MNSNQIIQYFYNQCELHSMHHLKPESLQRCANMAAELQINHDDYETYVYVMLHYLDILYGLHLNGEQYEIGILNPKISQPIKQKKVGEISITYTDQPNTDNELQQFLNQSPWGKLAWLRIANQNQTSQSQTMPMLWCDY